MRVPLRHSTVLLQPVSTAPPEPGSCLQPHPAQLESAFLTSSPPAGLRGGDWHSFFGQHGLKIWKVPCCYMRILSAEMPLKMKLGHQSLILAIADRRALSGTLGRLARWGQQGRQRFLGHLSSFSVLGLFKIGQIKPVSMFINPP